MSPVLAASDLAGPLIMFGAVVLAFVFGRLAGRRNADRTDGNADDMNAAEYRRESADRALAQLDDMSRDVIARAETKIRVLNELVARAERLGTRLAETTGVPNERLDEVHSLSTRGLTPEAIAEQTGLEPADVRLMLGLNRLSPDQVDSGEAQA